MLDIGCNAGFYSLEMKRRGARRVLGIDTDERYLAQAHLAAEISELEIEFRRMSVWEIATLGERFDLVIFMGVFYHLRHPLLALDLIHEHVAKDRLLFQSMQRGTRAVMPLAQDYDPLPSLRHSAILAFRRCISWSGSTAGMTRTGGSRTAREWRRCFARQGLRLKSSRKKRCTCAGGRR